MDVLSDVLRVLDLSGAIFLRAELSAPWSIRMAGSETSPRASCAGADRHVPFHVIVSGSCRIRVDGGEAVDLGPGDAVILPHGRAHHMASDLAVAPVAGESLLPSGSTDELIVLSHGGGGEITTVLCGFLSYDRAIFDPLFASLPSLIVTRAGRGAKAKWLDTTVAYILHEVAAEPSPGGRCMLMLLTEMLFVEALRHHLEERTDEYGGWLAAIRDPSLGRAMAAIHAEPARPWTVPDLARIAGLSRSVLAERFARLVGRSPIEYLTWWRLQVAGRLLREQSTSVAEIAEQVGYESLTAFHRAFKRSAGMTPAEWRRRDPQPRPQAEPAALS